MRTLPLNWSELSSALKSTSKSVLKPRITPVRLANMSHLIPKDACHIFWELKDVNGSGKVGHCGGVILPPVLPAGVEWRVRFSPNP